MSDHTPTPWAYRPNEHDDWGFIRGPDGSLAATARNSRSQDDFDENRRTGTDPYGANAAFIVKAVNAHDAMVKAMETARRLIGAINDTAPPAVKESNINMAWHVLDDNLRALETLKGPA